MGIHQLLGTITKNDNICTLTGSRLVQVLNHRFELVQVLSILYQRLEKKSTSHFISKARLKSLILAHNTIQNVISYSAKYHTVTMIQALLLFPLGAEFWKHYILTL